MGSAAARLARLSKSLGQLDQTLVEAAAEAVAKGVLERVASDTGGDRRMSGFGARAVPLTVDVQPLGRDGVRLVPGSGQAGQWAILNSGARPHDVVARNAQALSLGGGRFAVRVRNVRSPAKRTWDAAVDQSIPRAVDAARAEFHKAVNGD